MIEHLEAGFKEVTALIQFCMEAIAAFCVLMGLASSVLVAVRNPVQVMATHFLLLRLRLGSWLALALEFQLGADIVATTVAPTFEELGKLGAIALIRTFLNYFLNRELTQEEEREAQLRTLQSSLEPERSSPPNL